MSYCPKCKKLVDTDHYWEEAGNGMIRYYDVCDRCGTEIPDSSYFKKDKVNFIKGLK